METAQMVRERALRFSSNLFNINGVPTESEEGHLQSVAYAANLFTIAAALQEAAIEEVI
jgi:hypothetical protein